MSATKHYLLSVDPGLDRVAFAWWDVTDFQGSPSARVEDAAQRLLSVFCVDTDPKAVLALRLRLLWNAGEGAPHGEVSPFAEHLSAVIELPALAGDYRRNTGQGGQPKTGKAMQGSLLATGAIIAGIGMWCAADRLTLEPASRTRRETKQIIGRKVIDIATATGKSFPNNDDTRSAVYIGLTADWRVTL